MPVPFDVDFTSPGSSTNLTAATSLMSGDPPSQPSAVALTWLALPVAPENLLRAELWAIDGVAVTRILTFTDPAITSYIYPFPRSRQTTEYRIIQWLADGRTGLWGTDSEIVTMDYVSLVSTINPTTKRVILQARTSESEEWTQTQDWHIPAGGDNYKEIAGSLRGLDIPVTAQMFDRIDGSGVTSEVTKTRLRTIFDAKTETICLRNYRGLKAFGKINGNVSVPYVYGANRYNVSFSFRRTSFTEG